MRIHCLILLRKDRLDPWVLPGRFKNIWRFRRSPCRLLRLPERIGLKSYLRLSALVSKIILDYVIRRLDAVSAGLKPVEMLNLR
jgi:hypothetical protein